MRGVGGTGAINRECSEIRDLIYRAKDHLSLVTLAGDSFLFAHSFDAVRFRTGVSFVSFANSRQFANYNKIIAEAD